MASRKVTEEVRSKFMAMFEEALTQAEEEALRVATNEIAVPVVHEGEEMYIVVQFRIPTGTRDGVAYDGHAEAEMFIAEQATKAEMARAKAEAKARKIEQDKKRRKKIAEQKEGE